MDNALVERLQQVGSEAEVAAKAAALSLPAFTAPAGVLLARPGEPATHLHLLAQGWATHWRSLRDGRRQVVALRLSGDICDLDRLISRQTTASLSTCSPCRIKRLPLQPLQLLMNEAPSLRLAFQRLLQAERFIAAELIVSLGRRSAVERIAHLLCEIAVRLGAVPHSDTVGFPLPLTRTELAEITGLSVAQVNHSLQTLRRRLGLEFKKRRVTIPSWFDFVALADFDPRYLGMDTAGSRNEIVSEFCAAPRDWRPQQLHLNSCV